MKTMEKYLKENNTLTEIKILNHCHGTRLEIYKGYQCLVSVVESNIQTAWEKAQGLLSQAERRIIEKEKQDCIRRLKTAQAEVRKYKRRINELKERY